MKRSIMFVGSVALMLISGAARADPDQASYRGHMIDGSYGHGLPGERNDLDRSNRADRAGHSVADRE